MYMPYDNIGKKGNATNINTSLREKQVKKEDPKKPSVIVKKIGMGLLKITLAVAVFTMSSWMLPVIFNTIECLNKQGSMCPFPANENAPPYASRTGKYNMDPFQAFLNIIMSTLSGGLIGLSRGVKCCDKKSPNNPFMKGGGTSNALTKIKLQIGGVPWKPFDIYSKDIGWPYDQVGSQFTFGFNYWLGSTQIKAWSIPRQMVQIFFLFLANLMDKEMGEGFAWVAKFVITLFLPVIFVAMLYIGLYVSAIATFWGGFLSHLMEGDFPGMIWGFFCTFYLMVFNVPVQGIEMLGSIFLIPAMNEGSSYVKTNWLSTKNGGYREIILGGSFLAFIIVVLSAFAPLF